LVTIVAVFAAKRTIHSGQALISIHVDSIVDRSWWSWWCRSRWYGCRRSGRLRIRVGTRIGRRTSSCEGKVLEAAEGINRAA